MSIQRPAINATNKVEPLSRPSLPSPQSIKQDCYATKLQNESRHPWGLTDYHMYLSNIEKGQDVRTRIRNFMLLESNQFRKVQLDELSDPRTFANIPQGPHVVAFSLLPLLPHRAIELPSLQALVLAFDLQKHHIQAYFFQCCPDSVSDLGSKWGEGSLMIDVKIDRFLDLYEYVLQDNDILSTGLFNSFQETKRELPVGMDLTVLLKCTEFLSDAAKLIWKDPKTFCDFYKEHDSNLRGLLQQSSTDAWIAAIRKQQSSEAYSKDRTHGNSTLARQLILNQACPVQPSGPASTARSSGSLASLVRTH